MIDTWSLLIYKTFQEQTKGISKSLTSSQCHINGQNKNTQRVVEALLCIFIGPHNQDIIWTLENFFGVCASCRLVFTI